MEKGMFYLLYFASLLVIPSKKKEDYEVGSLDSLKAEKQAAQPLLLLQLTAWLINIRLI